MSRIPERFAGQSQDGSLQVVDEDSRCKPPDEPVAPSLAGPLDSAVQAPNKRHVASFPDFVKMEPAD